MLRSAYAVLCLAALTTCTQDTPLAAAATTDDPSLRALADDLAANHACDALRSQYVILRSGGLRVTSCSVTRADGRAVVRLDGDAWRGDAITRVRAAVPARLSLRHDAANRTGTLAFELDGDPVIEGDAAGLVDALTRRLDGHALAAPTALPTDEVELGALAVAGPFDVARASRIAIDSHAAARVTLVCAEDATRIVDAHVARAPRADAVPLARVDLHGTADAPTSARLRLARVRCPVVVIAEPLAPVAQGATIAWRFE